MEIATSMSEKIELYSPAYWKKWKLGVQVANKQDGSERNVNSSQAKNLHALAGRDLESGAIVKEHDRSGEVSRASTSTASLSVNQHVPTVDHGVAKVKNIRSYKTALADSIQLPAGWQPDKAKLNVDVDPFLPTRYGGPRRARHAVVDVEPRLIGLKPSQETKIPFSKLPGQFGEKQFNSLHRSTSLGTFMQGNRFENNTRLNADGAGPGSYTIESIPDKRGGAFSFSSRTKYVNPSNAIPGPVYNPRYTATKNRVQGSNFSKFGPRWNSTDLKNGQSTLGPKYDIPSTMGIGHKASFAYHDDYQAKKAAEAIRTDDPTLYEFKNFGYGCNLEEHIKYGQCLDGKCSERSRWEQTNKLKTRMKSNRIHDTGTGNKKNFQSKHRTTGHDTPLHLACRAGDVKAFKTLLKGTNDWDHAKSSIVWRGPDINKINKDGQTPLHLICLYNNLIFCCILLQYERQTVDLDIQDNRGDTALHITARVGNEHLLMKLLQAGANPDLQNNEGDMPKDVCSNQKCFQLTREASDILDVKAQLKRYRLRAEELQERQRRRSLV